MYKSLFAQHITYYNRQWYCYLCNIMMQDITKVQNHIKKHHSLFSPQVFDLLNNLDKLSNENFRLLLTHSIVIRDIQDYFCLHCQCSISSLKKCFQHLKEKKHEVMSMLECSANEQQNLCDDTNDKQINSIDSEDTMESDCSSKIQSISDNKLTEVLNSSMANKVVASIPFALLRENKTYNNFLMQNIIHYGQWYCHLCKSMLQSLSDATYHLQKVHRNDNKKIHFSDFEKECMKSLDVICPTLLNHKKAMQNMPQDYFCVICEVPILSSDQFYIHTNGKKHKKNFKKKIQEKYIKNLSKRSRNKLNVANSMIDNQNVSISTFVENDSKQNSVNNSGDRENTLLPKSCDKNNVSNVLKIEKSVNMMFCCLCDMFMNKIIVNNHITGQQHISILLKATTEQNVTCIIPLEKEKSTIRSIQPNGRKFDGSTWPKCIETVAEYICDQCDKTIEEDDIINHEITIHKKDTISSMEYINNWSQPTRDFNIDIYYPLFKCSFCNEIIHGISSLLNHLTKYEHEESIQSLIYMKEKEYKDCKDIQTYLEPLEFINIIFFENNDGNVQIKEQPVIYIKNFSASLYKNSKKRFTYICFACKDKLANAYEIIEHLSKRLKHLKHFHNIFFTYKFLIFQIHDTSENVNETYEMKSLVSEKYALNNSLKKCEINERQIDTKQCRNQNLMATENISNQNNILHEQLRNAEKKNSQFFIPDDVITEINKYIKMNVMSSPSHTRSNKKNAVYYNKKYDEEFLDFENIMFTCNERKLDDIKSNLTYFLPQDDKMLCLVCDCDPQLANAQAIYEHINCWKHVIRLQELKKDEKHLKLLSELMKPMHSKFIQCFVCRKRVSNIYNNKFTDVECTDHIKLSSHQNFRKKLLKKANHVLEDFKNLWYNIQYFACANSTCNMRFNQKIRFLEHLKLSHKEVLKDNTNSMFDFCLTCTTLWYKDKSNVKDIHIDYQIHCQLQLHQYLQKNNDFAIPLLPQSLKTLLKDAEKIAGDLFKLANDVSNDSKTTVLTNALRDIFRTCQLPIEEIYVFGSRSTGLALPNSDVDVYLHFGDECTELESIKSRSRQIRDCLLTDHENWNIELTLDKSRIPLIKLKHRLTGLQCDLSFTKSLSVEVSKFIKSFNMSYPPCQELILFLKKWLLLGDLAGSKKITNYALVWLVIFYLQNKFGAPSIAVLIKKHNQSKIINGWEVGIGDTIFLNLPQLTIHDLLLGFFEYYGKFDYMRFVVCPLLGRICEKKVFTEISTIPDSMSRYIEQLKSENPEYFRIDSPMCVQDPFDLSHNLTKAVSILTLRDFKHYCNESLSVLHKDVPSPKKKFKHYY